jgi:hypothetical protein
VPSLNIPKSYRDGLLALLSMDRAGFDQLLQALESHPETSITTPLRPLNVEIRGLEKKVTDDIFSVIVSLYRVWARAGDQTSDAFGDDVLQAISEFDPIGQSAEARARIHAVLNIEALASLSKARAVLTDNQYDFYDAKILTDLRYAFRPDPTAEPYGAVIVHILKLSYHEEAEHKSFFVALDSEDLKKLRLALERAEKKEEVLRKHLDMTQIHYFGKGE